MNHPNETKKVIVDYRLNLTGSKFFDSVIYMKAKELTKNYEGILVAVDGRELSIKGELDELGASRLRDELGFYGTENS